MEIFELPIERIKVVNVRLYDGDDLAYIGRGSPLENIWSHKPSKYSYVTKVDSAEIAIDLYRKYLYKKIKEKDQRICYELKVMLAFLESSGSIALGCFCKDKHGDGQCHGDVVKEVLERMYKLNSEKKL